MNKAITVRRSVRKFTNQPINDKTIETLLRAAMQAPSAKNQQPWEFLVVRDPGTRAKLSAFKPAGTPIIYAQVAIVLLANTERMSHRNLMEQDMGAATENLLLQAADMDLGAVWMGIAGMNERADYVTDLFNLPENILPFAVVAVGVPDGAGNRFVDRFDASRIHYETMA